MRAQATNAAHDEIDFHAGAGSFVEFLDDVVVDDAARGQGVGEALVNACLDVARARGAQVAELQSGVQREAANRLYPRMGFKRRESNLYRLQLG